MAERTEETGRARCPRWVKLALIASVCVNLAMIGVVAGQAMQQRPERNPRLSWAQAQFLRLLPEDRQPEAEARMLAEAQAIMAVRRRVFERHDALIAALRAETEAEASRPAGEISTLLTARTEVLAEFRDIADRQMAAILAELSPAEREEVAERLDAATDRWAERAGIER